MDSPQQSSDVFSQHGGSPQTSIVMDEDYYISLVLNIKKGTHFIKQDLSEADLGQLNFKIKDFKTCIFLGLSSIKSLLEVKDIEKITYYLEDSMEILQSLSKFIRRLFDAQIMRCDSLKAFPLVISEILYNVYVHCHESETLYGEQLCAVEQQLKGLFRNCEELQTVYFMTSEKHLIFDLTKVEETQMLIDVVSINLKIGEVVLDLSVKSMAEQWKGYTQICKKYSEYLLDKDVYHTTQQQLCTLISDNIDIVMIANQQQKLILRSIKVANFLLKILIKMYKIFKQCVKKNFKEMINLFCYIKMHCKEYLEEQRRSPQLIDKFDRNICEVLDSFIDELLFDKDFLYELNNFKLDTNIRNVNLTPGYIILLMTTMEQTSQRRDCHIIVREYTLETIILNVFNILHSDYKHIILNNNIINMIVNNCVALISCFSQEQYSTVERCLYEGIMNSDCFVAMFASHLWTVLIRFCSSKLRHEHLKFLCEIYIKLNNNNKLFYSSPQRVYLASTIERIFVTMSDDEKIIFLSDFVLDDTNLAIWSVLQIKNLPTDQCKQYTKIIFIKFKLEMKKFSSGNYNNDNGIRYFIMLLNVIATCPLNNIEVPIKDDILKIWSKLCKINLEENEIFVQYFIALSTIVEILIYNGSLGSKDFDKILHIIETMETSSIKIITFNLLFKLSIKLKNESLNLILSDYVQKLTNTENVILNYIFLTINTTNSESYKTILESIEKHNFEELNKDIKFSDIKFIHKCPEIIDNKPMEKSSNFDIADIDTLFSTDSDEEEPAPKKAKPNEIDIILKKLEENTELLCNLKKISKKHCNRINTICNKLKKIL